MKTHSKLEYRIVLDRRVRKTDITNARDTTYYLTYILNLYITRRRRENVYPRRPGQPIKTILQTRMHRKRRHRRDIHLPFTNKLYLRIFIYVWGCAFILCSNEKYLQPNRSRGIYDANTSCLFFTH